MYYLKHEQEYFIGYKESMIARCGYQGAVHRFLKSARKLHCFKSVTKMCLVSLELLNI